MEAARPLARHAPEAGEPGRADPTGLGMPGAVSEALEAASRRVELKREELLARMLAAIREIPEYGAIDDDAVWDEVVQHASASIELFYNIFRAGKPPRTKVGQYYARRRGAQGVVSLPSLRAAYVSGTRILWTALLNEVRGEPALRDEMLDRASWAIAHVDAVTAAISDAYYEAQREARHRDQLTRDLFDEIVDGDPASTGALERRAHLAGLESSAPLRVIVFRWSSAVPGQSVFEGLPPVTAVAACAEAAGRSADRVLAARRGNELLFVVPWREPEASLERLRTSLGGVLGRLMGGAGEGRAGVSGLIDGVAALRKAHHECARAIELGAILEPEAAIHFYDDHVLDDLFYAAPDQGDRLIAQNLHPLLALGEGGERLIETLDAYLRSGRNLKGAAAELEIHRNTLNYRLDQIRKSTGLDLEDATQRLRVEAALRFLALRRRRERWRDRA